MDSGRFWDLNSAVAKNMNKKLFSRTDSAIVVDMDLLNKVMMIGNLTREPELRKTGSGTAVTEISLALDPPGGGKGQEGTPAQTEPIFVDVVLWERNAENAVQYLKKGSPVLIEGRLRMDRWEDKETKQTRTKLKVTGDKMRFLNLGSREGNGGDQARGEEQQGRSREVTRK